MHCRPSGLYPRHSCPEVFPIWNLVGFWNIGINIWLSVPNLKIWNSPKSFQISEHFGSQIFRLIYTICILIYSPSIPGKAVLSGFTVYRWVRGRQSYRLIKVVWSENRATRIPAPQVLKPRLSIFFLSALNSVKSLRSFGSCLGTLCMGSCGSHFILKCQGIRVIGRVNA